MTWYQPQATVFDDLEITLTQHNLSAELVHPERFRTQKNWEWENPSKWQGFCRYKQLTVRDATHRHLKSHNEGQHGWYRSEASLVSITSSSSWKLANKPSMFTHKEKWNLLMLPVWVQLWVYLPQTGTITCIFAARDGATTTPCCLCICVQFCLWPKSPLTRHYVSLCYPAVYFTFPISSLYSHKLKYISPPPSRQIRKMAAHYSGFQHQLENREWGYIHFLFPKKI